MGSSSSKTVFSASYAPTGRAACKRCRQAIAKGDLRLSRAVKNQWTGDRGFSVFHYHLEHGMAEVAAMRCLKYEPVLKDTTDLPPSVSVAVQGLFATAKKKWATKCAQKP